MLRHSLSVCVCLHHVELCTHLYIYCGLDLARNVSTLYLGDVHGDNLWSDSATRDSGSLGGSITEG